MIPMHGMDPQTTESTFTSQKHSMESTIINSTGLARLMTLWLLVDQLVQALRLKSARWPCESCARGFEG